MVEQFFDRSAYTNRKIFLTGTLIVFVLGLAACQTNPLSEEKSSSRIIATGYFAGEQPLQARDHSGQILHLRSFSFRVVGRPKGYLSQAYEDAFFASGRRFIQFVDGSQSLSERERSGETKFCPTSIDGSVKYLIFLRPIRGIDFDIPDVGFEMTTCLRLDQSNSSGLVADFEEK